MTIEATHTRPWKHKQVLMEDLKAITNMKELYCGACDDTRLSML
uniref:Uncharacterized protein n=1 Tax=Rhizophora mucronata TaxID=61149 RepID=A0A2P2PBC0_RHIMU